ncbi:MAG: hypothetical protein BSOLF_0584 [Candidatus Carbobacillus altaicus]|uniref:Uncharacterized protein n=1 Tax=Candidatus Carbonibacillus altaicus TaxID=2163959 RepID=A0A2R6Y0J8_9BACL|nr:MAG: hypothetical protein BSOLF_0584 [Candidatus Carbobacillus altaicus]
MVHNTWCKMDAPDSYRLEETALFAGSDKIKQVHGYTV